MAIARIIDSGDKLDIHTDQNGDVQPLLKTGLSISSEDYFFILTDVTEGIVLNVPFYNVSDPQSNSLRELVDTIQGYLDVIVLPSAAAIKTLYESNANTNAFTDAYQLQLDNIGTPVMEAFTPTPLQTVFTIANTDLTTDRTLVEVNGQLQEEGVDYTLTTTTLTWLDNDFTLDTTDRLIVYYSK